MHVSIVIPTYNGKHLLEKYLPSVLSADAVDKAELIIADDGSEDGTFEWLTVNVPHALVVRLESNSGFSKICNLAIEQATGDAVLLLNNDVEVEQNFLTPLVERLESDSTLFAVNSRILIPGRQMLDEGEKVGGFHHGIFYVDCPIRKKSAPALTLYATACSALYRLDRVRSLGGFDSIFSPFYWEDVDLSYRALRRGWKVLYEPRSTVYHQHETSTSRFDPRYRAMIRERNQFFFVWKNMTDRQILARSIFFGSLVGLSHAYRKKNRGLLEGYCSALRYWPELARLRAIEAREAVLTDNEILSQFSSTYSSELVA